MMEEETGCSSGINDDKLLDLRLSNISETQKRILRLFSFIYLLFFLVMLTWYNTNFESSPLEKNIERLEKALTVEMLKPLDNFLERTASCFPSFFSRFNEAGVVNQTELKRYIELGDNENKKQISSVAVGSQEHWPVDKMKDLLDSEQHWQDCAFWACQDTLISYLFSLNTYLESYFVEKMQALSAHRLQTFWATTHSIDASADSFLVYLSVKMDSLSKPFEYEVQVGWNPFEGGPGMNRTTLWWGRSGTFDDYSSYDLGNLLLILQKLNHVSWFKQEVIRHRDKLLSMQGDLDSILSSFTSPDSIRFSDEKTDIRFYDLSTILKSSLLRSDNLADSLLHPELCNLSYSKLTGLGLSDTLLDVYFPGYKQVLVDFNIVKVGGIKVLKNIFVSQRGTAKQKIQVLGAEISSRSILYFLPILCLFLYFIVFLLLRLFLDLLKPDQHGLWEETNLVSLQTEVLKVPLLITVRPSWIVSVLFLIPAFGTICILIDQMFFAGGRGIVLNMYIVSTLVVLQVIVMLRIRRYVSLLQKLVKGTYSNSLVIPEKKSSVDLEQPVEDNDS